MSAVLHWWVSLGFISGSLFGGSAAVEVSSLKTTNLWEWVSTITWVETVQDPQPDPQAIALVETYLQDLTDQGFISDGHGVWLQSDLNVLLDHQGTTPLPAASLTKLATTLAALDTWGTAHTFETLISTNGAIADGILQGDLVVHGTGDPFFVWEEAIALGNALNQIGIQQVDGNLIITGDFAFNYETDPDLVAPWFQSALNADWWPYEAEAQYLAMPEDTPRPQVVVTGDVVMRSQPVDAAATPLVRHQSLPLHQILKAMNVYSNNPIADMLAEQLGGANQVASRAANAASVPTAEIQLINGSGLGVENQISPRAATAMLITIQNYLDPLNLTVADVLPVMGRDEGTLIDRTLPQDSAVKTGTLAQVSALAGAFPTQDQGIVWFAIINQGWDIPLFRDRQDVLLNNLEQTWQAVNQLPSDLQPGIIPPVANQPTYQLGDPGRNTLLSPVVRPPDSDSPNASVNAPTNPDLAVPTEPSPSSEPANSSTTLEF